MAMWGRMPLPSIPICPWEAQEYAQRDRTGIVGSNFRFVADLESVATRLAACGRPCVAILADGPLPALLAVADGHLSRLAAHGG